MRSRTALAVAAVLCAATPLLAQQPAASPWPPPGTFNTKDVDIQPRAIKQTRADYTADAMRVGIAGMVVLEGVVNVDGSVGEVRVVRSLDALHGLDEACVAALRQWQFSPGMKSGKPVPVVVSVEMTFTMREGPASFVWPGGFTTPPAAAGSWKTADVDTSGVRLHIEYPEAWTLRRDATPQDVVRLDHASAAATMAIGPVVAAAGSFSRPFSPDDLRSHAGRMDSEARAFGQISTSGWIWVWTESVAPDGTVTWRFQTVADEERVDVRMVVHQQELAEMTAELGAMFRRLTITSR